MDTIKLFQEIINHQFVNIRHKGRFMAAEQYGDSLTVNRVEADAWEVFSIISLGGNKVAIKSHNGYLHAVNAGGASVSADKAIPAGYETFEIEFVGHRVAFKTFDQAHYLSCDHHNGFKLNARASEKKDWELFTILPAVNPTFGKQWKLIEIMGVGWWAVTWKAQDDITHEIKALKIFKKLPDPSMLERDMTGLVKRIKHPRVVTPDYWKRVDGRTCIVSPLLVGGDVLKKIDTATQRQKAVWIRDLIEGVEAIHAKNIAHCDIHAGNLLVDDGGRLLVTDFGMAKEFGQYTNGSVNVADNLMSDEQKKGQISKQSDYWMLGLTIHHIATGINPFVNNAVKLHALKHGEPGLSENESFEGVANRMVNLLVKKEASARCISQSSLKKLIGMANGC